MIFHIHGFSGVADMGGGPHWDAAIIEADSAEEAEDRLEAWLADNAEDCETIWAGSLIPREKWRTYEVEERPVIFVLGSGCR